MGCKYICDGCGKEMHASYNTRDYFKPNTWFQRSDKDGIQIACSRDCIDAISDKSGKTSVVLPV